MRTQQRFVWLLAGRWAFVLVWKWVTVLLWKTTNQTSSTSKTPANNSSETSIISLVWVALFRIKSDVKCFSCKLLFYLFCPGKIVCVPHKHELNPAFRAQESHQQRQDRSVFNPRASYVDWVCLESWVINANIQIFSIFHKFQGFTNLFLPL